MTLEIYENTIMNGAIRLLPSAHGGWYYKSMYMPSLEEIEKIPQNSPVLYIAVQVCVSDDVAQKLSKYTFCTCHSSIEIRVLNKKIYFCTMHKMQV
jgi:hypothetical protein